MKEDIKNIIKKTAENYSDDINPDIIWNGVEKKLERRRKRFIAIWWFGGVMLLGVILSMLYFSNLGDSSNAENSIMPLVRATSDSIQITTIESSKQKKGDTEKVEELSFNSLGNSNLNSALSSEIISSVALSDRDKFESNFKSDFDHLNILQSESKAYSEILRQEDLKSNEVADKYFDFRNEYKENEIAKVLDAGWSIRKELVMSKVKYLKVGLLDIERDLVVIDAAENFLEYSILEDEDERNYFTELEIYSGISLGNKSIETEDKAYATARNNSEKLLEQWSIGLRFKLFKYKNLKLESGIRYSMTTDKWVNENIFKDIDPYFYNRYIFENDELILQDSSVLINGIDSVGQEYTIEQYNSQRIISIPLSISMHKSINKFDFGVGLGVYLNYHLSDTHVILSDLGRPVINRVGGKWVSPSMNGFLSTKYRFNNAWAITSRFNFQKLSLADHQSIKNLNSNYQFFGLELGLIWRFGK